MKEILNSHPVANLKKEISKTNIKNYSKLKKAELVSLMMKHKDRFDHIKKYEKSGLVEKKLKTSNVEVEKKTKAKPTMTQEKKKKLVIKGKASLRQIHDYDEAHKDLKNDMKYNKAHSDYNTSAKRKALKDKIDKKHQVAFLFKKNNPEGFSKERKRVKETIKKHMGGMLTYGEVVQQHL